MKQFYWLLPSVTGQLRTNQIRFRSDILHPTHFVMMTLKKRLLDLYGLYPEPQNNPELLRRLLERQIELGEEQLAIADKLQPG